MSVLVLDQCSCHLHVQLHHSKRLKAITLKSILQLTRERTAACLYLCKKWTPGSSWGHETKESNLQQATAVGWYDMEFTSLTTFYRGRDHSRRADSMFSDNSNINTLADCFILNVGNVLRLSKRLFTSKARTLFLWKISFVLPSLLLFLLTIICHIFALILRQRGWRQHIAVLQSLWTCASVLTTVFKDTKRKRANIAFRQFLLVNVTTGSYCLKIAMHLTLRQHALGCTDFCLLLAGNTMWVQGKKITTTLFGNGVAWCCSS